MSDSFNPFEVQSVLEASYNEVQEDTQKQFIRSEKINFDYSLSLEYLRDIKSILGVRKLAKFDPKEFGRDEKVYIEGPQGNILFATPFQFEISQKLWLI